MGSVDERVEAGVAEQQEHREIVERVETVIVVNLRTEVDVYTWNSPGTVRFKHDVDLWFCSSL